MTSKQRANLKSIASNLDPIFQIGKAEISENQVISIGEALDKRELIKISVLQNSPIGARDAANKIAQSLKAEVVDVIGSKIILYRFSKNKDVKHIEF